MISVTQAAKILGITDRRVRQLIQDGKLVAQKVGAQYVIMKQDIEKLQLPGSGNWAVK